MTPDRNDRISAALSALDALRVTLVDLSSDIDVLHDEEADAEKIPDTDDPFSAAAEEALLDAYDKISTAIEQLAAAGQKLDEAISAKPDGTEEDKRPVDPEIFSTYFRERA
ncbi:hypothetical protein J2Y63_004143 [Shinella sp. BE166]|uniref:hypothetical protein n=1 Tax=Shinella sp. BE166 TaxID=3373918 RepID=UPI003EBAE07D